MTTPTSRYDYVNGRPVGYINDRPVELEIQLSELGRSKAESIYIDQRELINDKLNTTVDACVLKCLEVESFRKVPAEHREEFVRCQMFEGLTQSQYIDRLKGEWLLYVQECHQIKTCRMVLSRCGVDYFLRMQLGIFLALITQSLAMGFAVKHI